jgi:hypothetical protein
MKQHIKANEWIGRIVDATFMGHNALWVAFTDDTYGRVEPEDYDDGLELVEHPGYVKSVKEMRLMHSLGIITSEELKEAEEKNKEELKKVEEQNRKNDLMILKKILEKYPEMRNEV